MAVAFWARRGEPLGLDQGLFACFTRWVPPLLPYRDLFDSKPPLFLYSYSLARALPGGLVQQIWELDALWLLATMALAFAVAARAWGRWAGLAATALVLLGEWAPGFGGWWARAQADEWAALPMLGAAWAALSGRPLVTGVLVGVAGLYKIPAMAMAAAWPIVWRSWRRTLWMGAGLMIPWALAAAWFAAHGALGDFTDGVFVYHRYNAEFIAPPWGGVLVDFTRQLATGAPLLLLLAAVGAAREPRRMLPWILLSMAAVILERQLAGYQFLLIVPSLALAGGLGAAEIARRRSVPLAAAALALVALTGWQWWRGYGVTPDYERGAFSPRTEEQAAEYLRAHTAPSDGIFVWGLSPGLYALADRHPTTRYPFHKILYTDAPLSQMIPGLDERRAELLERFDREPPRYVLVGRRDRNGFEPEDSFTSLRRFTELDERLHRDYQPETEIGRFIILRRR
jgi:hypothetical protein